MNHSHDPDDMSDENRENDHHHDHHHDYDHSFDEPMLRRLLHDAVRDLEPQPQALNRLRQAIPARRAWRRQAMAGTAIGILLVGVAVPALVHVAVSIGQDTANTASTSASRTPGIGRDGYGGNEFGGDSGIPAGALNSGGGGSAPSSSGKPPTSESNASPGASSQPPGTLTAAPPLCARAQLGNGSAQTGTPDSQGRVYGSFTVLNISHISCMVTGGGQITVTGEGGTDASKIQVVDHTAGDPATGLPDARTLPLVLAPGKGYKVAFAWIPAVGGSGGCSRNTSSPTPGDTTLGGAGGAGGAGSSSGAGGTSSSATSPSGNSTDGSGTTSASSTPQNALTDAGSPSPTPTPAATAGISLSHVPQQGGPAAASTSISGACTGTVYRSAPMATTS
jgi:hypothetical protein